MLTVVEPAKCGALQTVSATRHRGGVTPDDLSSYLAEAYSSSEADYDRLVEYLAEIETEAGLDMGEIRYAAVLNLIERGDMEAAGGLSHKLVLEEPTLKEEFRVQAIPIAIICYGPAMQASFLALYRADLDRRGGGLGFRRIDTSALSAIARSSVHRGDYQTVFEWSDYARKEMESVPREFIIGLATIFESELEALEELGLRKQARQKGEWLLKFLNEYSQTEHPFPKRDIDRIRKTAAQVVGRAPDGSRHNAGDKMSRNEKVTVVYLDGRRLENVKFKKVQEDLLNGKCTLERRSPDMLFGSESPP